MSVCVITHQNNSQYNVDKIRPVTISDFHNTIISPEQIHNDDLVLTPLENWEKEMLAINFIFYFVYGVFCVFSGKHIMSKIQV